VTHPCHAVFSELCAHLFQAILAQLLARQRILRIIIRITRVQILAVLGLVLLPLSLHGHSAARGTQHNLFYPHTYGPTIAHLFVTVELVVQFSVTGPRPARSHSLSSLLVQAVPSRPVVIVELQQLTTIGEWALGPRRKLRVRVYGTRCMIRLALCAPAWVAPRSPYDKRDWQSDCEGLGTSALHKHLGNLNQQKIQTHAQRHTCTYKHAPTQRKNG